MFLSGRAPSVALDRKVGAGGDVIPPYQLGWRLLHHGMFGLEAAGLSHVSWRRISVNQRQSGAAFLSQEGFSDRAPVRLRCATPRHRAGSDVRRPIGPEFYRLNVVLEPWLGERGSIRTLLRRSFASGSMPKVAVGCRPGLGSRSALARSGRSTVRRRCH